MRNKSKLFVDEHLHVKAVKIKLVPPWFESNRIVHMDLFSASMTTTKILMVYDIQCFGDDKTIIKTFLETHLPEIELSSPEFEITLVSDNYGR